MNGRPEFMTKKKSSNLGELEKFVNGNTIKKLPKTSRHLPLWEHLRRRSVNPTPLEGEVLPEGKGVSLIFWGRCIRANNSDAEDFIGWDAYFLFK